MRRSLLQSSALLLTVVVVMAYGSSTKMQQDDNASGQPAAQEQTDTSKTKVSSGTATNGSTGPAKSIKHPSGDQTHDNPKKDSVRVIPIGEHDQ